MKSTELIYGDGGAKRTEYFEGVIGNLRGGLY